MHTRPRDIAILFDVVRDEPPVIVVELVPLPEEVRNSPLEEDNPVPPFCDLAVEREVAIKVVERRRVEDGVRVPAGPPTDVVETIGVPKPATPADVLVGPPPRELVPVEIIL